MRTIILCLSIIISAFNSSAQLTVTKKEGSSVVTKLGMGIKVNDGSSLIREQYTINDPNCPVQLLDASIETVYASSYSFRPSGDIIPKEPITAYEVVHVLYNIFGEHIKTLSNVKVGDIDVQTPFNKNSSWYATENNVSEYFVCVSYVANVRTKAGKIWHYSFKPIKEELSKLEISLEEGYLPKKDTEKN